MNPIDEDGTTIIKNDNKVKKKIEFDFLLFIISYPIYLIIPSIIKFLELEYVIGMSGAGSEPATS